MHVSYRDRDELFPVDPEDVEGEVAKALEAGADRVTVGTREAAAKSLKRSVAERVGKPRPAYAK